MNWDQRANRQNPPRARHAENPGRIPRPPGPHGGEVKSHPSQVSTGLLLKQDSFRLLQNSYDLAVVTVGDVGDVSERRIGRTQVNDDSYTRPA